MVGLALIWPNGPHFGLIAFPAGAGVRGVTALRLNDEFPNPE